MAKGINANIELDGVAHLQRFLKELPKRTSKKALKQAVNAGGTVVAKAARKEVPKKHGLLKKSITKKVKTYTSGNAVALIGSNKDTSETIDGRRHVPALYLHLVMGGTKPHAITSKPYVPLLGLRVSNHPGTKPNPFLQRAFEATKAEAAATMEAKLYDVLRKEAGWLS